MNECMFILLLVGFTLNTLLHSDGYGSGNPIIGADATTIMCHRYTPSENLTKMTKISDIVITGTGKDGAVSTSSHLYLSIGIPGLIRGDMVKEGATVIDIGMNTCNSMFMRGVAHSYNIDAIL